MKYLAACLVITLVLLFTTGFNDTSSATSPKQYTLTCNGGDGKLNRLTASSKNMRVAICEVGTCTLSLNDGVSMSGTHCVLWKKPISPE
jgi:hypothetical protein